MNCRFQNLATSGVIRSFVIFALVGCGDHEPVADWSLHEADLVISDDIYEPNDAFSQATNLDDAAFTWTGCPTQSTLSLDKLRLLGSNRDVFKFGLNRAGHPAGNMAVCAKAGADIAVAIYKLKGKSFALSHKWVVGAGSSSCALVSLGTGRRWVEVSAVRSLKTKTKTLTTSRYQLDLTYQPDSDKDGVVDVVDNCRWTPNSNQANSDGDAAGDACDDDRTPCRTSSCLFSLATASNSSRTLNLMGYMTHDRYQRNAEITRLVVVIHGRGRNADDYFTYAVDAADQAKALNHTMIVAPHFKRTTDTVSTDEIAWSSSSWPWGALSSNSGNPRASSFALLDQFLRSLASSPNYPNLKEIVVTGHSAGGQFAQRYALSNPVEQDLPCIAMRYVVANPSSMAYITRFRPDLTSSSQFYLPAQCPSGQRAFNDYGYGLDDLQGYDYLANTSALEIGLRYPLRKVIYLAGDADICGKAGSQPPPPCTTSSLDSTCGANLQGINRFERAKWYLRMLDRYFPHHQHQLLAVPGIGHSGRDMFQSSNGRIALFQ